MLKILGRKTSSNVQKVLWACAELELPFERDDIGGPFGGNDKPDYLALNPNGVVPTIIDDGYVLWESNSIVRYLAGVHGGGTLWPTDPQVRGDAERWMDWQLTTLSPAMVTVFRGLVRTPEDKRDHAAIAAARDRLSAALAMVDKALEGKAYLTGAEFTMGDIPVGIGTYRWFNLPIEREDYPNLERWYDSLTRRPGYAEHIMNPLE